MNLVARNACRAWPMLITGPGWSISYILRVLQVCIINTMRVVNTISVYHSVKHS